MQSVLLMSAARMLRVKTRCYTLKRHFYMCNFKHDHRLRPFLLRLLRKLVFFFERRNIELILSQETEKRPQKKFSTALYEHIESESVIFVTFCSELLWPAAAREYAPEDLYEALTKNVFVLIWKCIKAVSDMTNECQMYFISGQRLLLFRKIDARLLFSCKNICDFQSLQKN